MAVALDQAGSASEPSIVGGWLVGEAMADDAPAAGLGLVGVEVLDTRELVPAVTAIGGDVVVAGDCCAPTRPNANITHPINPRVIRKTIAAMGCRGYRP